MSSPPPQRHRRSAYRTVHDPSMYSIFYASPHFSVASSLPPTSVPGTPAPASPYALSPSPLSSPYMSSYGTPSSSYTPLPSPCLTPWTPYSSPRTSTYTNRSYSLSTLSTQPSSPAHASHTQSLSPWSTYPPSPTYTHLSLSPMGPPPLPLHRVPTPMYAWSYLSPQYMSPAYRTTPLHPPPHTILPTLAPEQLTQILSYLPLRDLIATSHVNKRFRALAPKAAPHLRKRLLDLAFLPDTGPVTLPNAVGSSSGPLAEPNSEVEASEDLSESLSTELSRTPNSEERHGENAITELSTVVLLSGGSSTLVSSAVASRDNESQAETVVGGESDEPAQAPQSSQVAAIDVPESDQDPTLRVTLVQRLAYVRDIEAVLRPQNITIPNSYYIVLTEWPRSLPPRGMHAWADAVRFHAHGVCTCPRGLYMPPKCHCAALSVQQQTFSINFKFLWVMRKNWPLTPDIPTQDWRWELLNNKPLLYTPEQNEQTIRFIRLHDDKEMFKQSQTGPGMEWHWFSMSLRCLRMSRHQVFTANTRWMILEGPARGEIHNWHHSNRYGGFEAMDYFEWVDVVPSAEALAIGQSLPDPERPNDRNLKFETSTQSFLAT
ncbi:hypothetical protein FISHEDRAFT_73194 [Fistulina hepatica ATCC 64428]|uniref:F-box domain-containing protein n=1 Tax=Fistulina hepatica ATCC 64428 TaxID=1128425 RepID=A0A0D7AD07_9AGAR|nr:hypothetical protein FISHEDRAFT_73194 [Fistulina hepatica ATCC 64428]